MVKVQYRRQKYVSETVDFEHVAGIRLVVRRIYSLEGGGGVRPPSSARSARTTFSNSASNLALSCSQPVKSPASRDRICCALPLLHSLSSRKPSRLSGITASTLRLRSFMSWRSFSKALSISLSTHQLVSEFLEQHSRILSHRRMP